MYVYVYVCVRVRLVWEVTKYVVSPAGRPSRYYM